MTHKLKINKIKCCIYFVLICSLLNGSVMWRFISGTVLNYAVLIVLQYVSLIAGILIVDNKIKKSILKISLLILIYLTVYAFATRYEMLTFYIYYVGVLVLFIFFIGTLIKQNCVGDFIDAFVSIVTFFAAISLVFWVFGSILNIMPGRTLETYNWAGLNLNTYSYYGLYFENPLQSDQILFGMRLIRNTGVYTEAPGYAGVLLYAVVLELVKERAKRNKVRFVILLCTLISTFSTKGLLILVIVVVVDYITSKESQNRTRWLVKNVLSIILIIMGFIVCSFIIEDKSTTGSYMVRLDDVYASIKAWMSSPIFGVGYNNLTEISKYFSVSRMSGAVGLSMGITALLAEGGLWLFVFYCGAFVSAIKCKALKKYRREIFLFSLMIFVNLLISNSGFSTLMIITLAFGYATNCIVESHNMGVKK